MALVADCGSRDLAAGHPGFKRIPYIPSGGQGLDELRKRFKAEES